MKYAKDGDLGPWLALFHLCGFSLRQKHQLLERWGSAAAISQLSAAEMTSAGLTEAKVAALRRHFHESAETDRAIDADLNWQSQPARHIVTLDSPLYPQRLKETPCPPLLLFVKGNAKYLSVPQLAIVGSRNATYGGREIARQFSRELAAAGLTVTSGMALGIDTQAHQGALDADGYTIAVLGCGADTVYPKRNGELADKIVAQGAIVSEFPLGTPPHPKNFPRRNRIVSGLSLGVLVVEAALKSGSLISANYAAEQGREVFAIPGSIRNPLSQGCHWLIQQGAALVQSSTEILEQLELPASPVPKRLTPEHQLTTSLSDIESRILQATDYSVTSLDVLLVRTGLQVNQLNQHLMALELQGLVRSIPGGFERTALVTSEV